MTKVSIKRLDSITKNDTTATEQINDNFKALQQAIENTVSRDGTVPNYMDADLDLNSYKIINAADPENERDVVTLKYFEEKAGGAIEAASEAKSSASKAASSAQAALVASNNAIGQLAQAEGLLTAAGAQLEETQQYVDAAKVDIDNTVQEAKDNISGAITQATEDVKQQALEAAQEAIDTAAAQATDIVIEHAETVIKPELNALVTSADEDATSAAESARVARVWATGEDAEVHEIEADEHSSRGYADLAMAIANTPEDVPVDTSKLLALEIIKGPKGDAGEADFSGDINFEGSFNVHGDDNHPVKVTSLAVATASGFQVVDSNGAGESEFEHYASGDRYGTRIANKSTATGKTVNVDLYQTTAGKSVLDLSKPDTILAPQLLDIIFPIGSYYLSEEDSCPLADWMEGCQWEKVGTSLVSGSEAAVVGNGMALGLTNGSSNSALQIDSNQTYLGARQGGYGYSAGRDVGSGNAGLGASKSLGVTKDPTKSGIVANLPTITVNIFRRTM
jgi:hypothetical protein